MVPIIKFSNNNKEWKEKPFIEIAQRISTTKISGELPCIEYEDIVSGEGCLNKNIYAKNRVKIGKAFIEGDVLFGKLRPYLKNILLADFKGVAVGDFWILRSLNILPYILYMLVNSKKFMDIANISTGSKMPRADWSLVSNSSFVIPLSYSEQHQIASYFKSLDSLIQSTTKKTASLKQLKSASLLSMFPQAGETKPRVRFKDFKGDWEKKTLNDCLDISKDRNINNDHGIDHVLSVSDDFGVINQIELLGRSYAGKSVSNYRILKKNEIVYTKSPLKSKPFGIIKQNTYKTGIVSVLYAVYIAKDGISADYIHYYFDPAWRLNAYMRPIVNKGAKNTMNISDETALEGFIMIPSSLDEQNQIASFFRTLDTQISLETQHLEKLKQIKATCLDKMFV